MAGKLLNLLALTSVALYASIYIATPVNALSSGHHHLNRQISHEIIAKRNKLNSNVKRCKQRPPTSISVSSVISSSIPTSSVVISTAPVSSPKPSSSAAQAPSPSKTVSTTPSSTPTSTGNGGNKKVGLAWANGPTSDLQFYATGAVNWVYSWDPYTPDPDNKYNLEYMPMLWGPDQVADFESVVKAGYAKYILGFNEPNEPGQSNLDPHTAATLWQQHIEPKRALGYQTCSPATSSNPNGFTWMQNFFDACNGGCTVDFICVHWYDVQASDFQTYVEKWHTTYNKDVFITEFAPQNFNGGAQPSVGDIWNFYQTVMPWIQQTSYIKGAFPFGFMHDMSNVNIADQLMATSGQPNDLGYYIINGDY
ncbi:hypothetical protein PHLCEN_2v10543 [Hermanssonia centrifuga]|uniref:Asl1-like glycosyl hydrolase catalytic domain-containing protein n=1 Tax=Hermanssonia centrifuga TaxID=98765 RepID=A0A2R6NMK8_9APHY|nr:hypothetical protein PHLCEN_2v10543 [Hermanssonia centrifuga]